MKRLINNKIAIRKVSVSAISLGIYLLSLSLATIDVSLGGSILRYIALLPIAVCTGYILTSGKIRVNLIHLLFLFYTIYLLFSLFYSINVNETLSRIISYMMFTVLLIATTGISYKEGEILFIRNAYLWAARITAVLTLIFATNIEGGRMSLDNGIFTEDPNYLCGYFIYPVIAIIAALLSNKVSSIRKAVYFLELLVYVYVILTTGSRGGLLGVCFGAAAYLLFYYIKRKDKLKIAISLMVFIIVAFALAKFTFSLLPVSVQERYLIGNIIKGRGTGRLDLWKNAFSMYQNSDLFRMLFGYGAGTIRNISINGLHMKNVAHNLWLETLLEQGIMGFFMLFCIMKTCFQYAWHKSDLIVSAVFIGMMGLTLSLSIYAYKPLWNLIILICLFSISDRRVQMQEEK